MNLLLCYRTDRMIRALVMWVLGWITARSNERRVDIQRENIKKILLVRGIFRMGDSILATPAILLARKNFPGARIDFVGPVISKVLFENLPIKEHYEIHRSFPKVCWTYIALLKQIRSVNYDLAVDVSGSSAAMGSFIVGCSGARFRAGLRGRWDRWFNVRFPRPAEKNKYRNLSELVGSMGLKTSEVFPTLVLTVTEKEQGRRRVEALVGQGREPVVAIFVGGRKTRGKRWAEENFLDLATGLCVEGARVIIFVGPEEKELIPYFHESSTLYSPVVFEPNPRSFAAMVAGCDLFVACDSGPVNLACALRVRTVAVFLKRNFHRWGPPPCLGRIVYRETGTSVKDVLKACLAELTDFSAGRDEPKIVNA